MARRRGARVHGSRVRVSPDVVWREVGGEIVMLDLRKGAYYGLQKVAAEIWKAISRGDGVDRIGHRLVQVFQVGEDRAQRDTLAFTRALVRKGLLRSR